VRTALWLWVLLGGSVAALGGTAVILLRLRRSLRSLTAARAQLRSEFLSDVSHELRTPLNALLGFAQILEADASLTEPQRRSVAIIRQSGQNLLTLVNGLVDPAREQTEPAPGRPPGTIDAERTPSRPAGTIDWVAGADAAVPPQHEIAMLHDLALAGSMREILERARWIEGLDSRYAPFARQLAGLAAAYESQAVLAFIVRAGGDKDRGGAD
jgi:signal transduction histidine kinase